MLLLGQPADCTGGEELVVETPRGTLVDVTVPVSIAPVSAGAPQRSIAVLYHPNPHAAMASDDSPGTPDTDLDPNDDHDLSSEPAPSPAECAASCLADVGCYSYTFANDTGQKICWHKDA